MFKRILMGSLLATAFAAPAMAEVSISGSAEMDFFYRTNQASNNGDGAFGQEIAIIVNVDGKDKLDSGDTLKWRLAQKVATDYRYDSFGQREAWIGYEGGWGELRFGNQFSNQYLALDWPYGAQGQGNLWADFGAQKVQYSKAVSYFSPKFGGFDFQAQYDLGSGTSDARAYEVTAKYVQGGLRLDAGFHEAKNDGHASSEALVFGGSTWGSGNDFSKENTVRAYNVGAIYKFDNGFDIAAGMKRNEWSGDVDNSIHGGNGKTTVDQYLVRAGYTTGKHNFNLGYQRVADSKTDGVTANDGMDVINAQYNYALSKNTSAFVQARHHMMDDANKSSVMHGAWQLDGAANGGKDSATRILVGTWTGF
ncbi:MULTISPECIES: porin [Deefgea]|uniref:Porin n=1 Tax=Deefgea chitinilytica TaxID=570276 RepID=A0ABS2CH77_9NEIS|nr:MULTISPECIES: porin [Deefgea]MBM5572798.1 porin [Deefgea chitinilytica]MBM9890035.1 porin [Deefgea sp. CFH1-16]